MTPPAPPTPESPRATPQTAAREETAPCKCGHGRHEHVGCHGACVVTTQQLPKVADKWEACACEAYRPVPLAREEAGETTALRCGFTVKGHRCSRSPHAGDDHRFEGEPDRGEPAAASPVSPVGGAPDERIERAITVLEGGPTAADAAKPPALRITNAIAILRPRAALPAAAPSAEGDEIITRYHLDTGGEGRRASLVPYSGGAWVKYEDCRALLARVEQAERRLADAAREINCAGPVDHRIRALKAEHAAQVAQLAADRERLEAPRPEAEWHEDYGAALWWLFPVAEPPYCGTPHDSDWPFDEDDTARLWWTPVTIGNRVHEAIAARTTGGRDA